MPRQARVILRNTAHHIVQRGHNRALVFIEEQDYLYYLRTLKEWKGKLGVRVSGYCLMTNHVHLILNPGEDEGSIGKLMKRLAGRQTRHVNCLERRTGSLWEGRYKSSPIETETYLLACSRYVDLNPVRARIVRHPKDYPWSSYRQKAGLAEEKWIDDDVSYMGLSPNPKVRQRLYAEYVSDDIPEGEHTSIQKALQRGQLRAAIDSLMKSNLGSVYGLNIEDKAGRVNPGKEIPTMFKNKSVPFLLTH